MFGRILAGVIGGGMATAAVCANESQKNRAHASWTTNHAPSVKWDPNWDRYSLNNVVLFASVHDSVLLHVCFIPMLTC